MKRTNSCAAALRRLSVLLLAVILTTGLLCSGSAYVLDSNEVSRMNVMLVIDGSGSLTMSGGTDRNGYRYNAIDLFLALLTNSGNNVGAIVFNGGTLLHAPISPINGKADKVALSQKIKNAGAQGETDIGGALSAAVDECTKATAQNGLKSVILLFSDGKTDLATAELTAASLEKKEEATTNAQNAGIRVHSIALTSSNHADPVELEEIASRTSGSFTEVKDASDLAKAFENFYKLIFPGASNEISQTTFPADGKLEFDIQIPTYGAEEVNIIVQTETLNGKTITAPSGVMSESAVEDATMTGGQYAVTKLVDPEKGLWKVNLTGVPGSDVTVNVLYNIDSTAQLKTSTNSTDYAVGDTATFQVNLLQQDKVITDSVVTQEYTAKLILTNLTTGQELAPIDMTPDANGTFVCTYTGAEYASYTAKAILSYSNLDLLSNELSVNFGNTSPVANPTLHEVKATVTPVSGKSKSVDISAFFHDAQDSTLTYSIVSSQLIQNTVNLDASGLLTVNTEKSRSGDVVIQATDSLGATAQMTVRFKVTNLTWAIFGTIIAGVLVGLAFAISAISIALNRPYKGMLVAKDMNGGFPRTHGGFRGKLPLAKLGILPNTTGIEGAKLVVIGNNQVEFRAKNQIYSGNGFQKNPKRVILSQGYNTIYADESHTKGIEIDLQPR